MAVLATWAPEDAVLGAVAPRALAAATGTSLLIDLNGFDAGQPGGTTVADLVATGPRAEDLTPRRRGVAMLPGGGASLDDAVDLGRLLARTWPAVVVACPTHPARPSVPGVVPIVLDLPRRPAHVGAAVVQSLAPSVRRRSAEAVWLPPVGRSTIDRLLDGRLPVASRWMRAWRAVWGRRWP